MPDTYGNPSTRPGGGTQDVTSRRSLLQGIADALGMGRPDGSGGAMAHPAPATKLRGYDAPSPSADPVFEPVVGTGEVPHKPEREAYGGPLDQGLGLARTELRDGVGLRLGTELTEPSEQDRAIQTLLNEHGLEVEVDGFAGPQTIAALNEFVQRYLPRYPEITEGEELDSRVIGLLERQP